MVSMDSLAQVLLTRFQRTPGGFSTGFRPLDWPAFRWLQALFQLSWSPCAVLCLRFIFLTEPVRGLTT